MGTPSRLCHHSLHGSHLCHQPGSRAGRRAWHCPECVGAGASALCAPPKTRVGDEWFVDDGQVFVRPFQFDPFLRALDGALATFGATQEYAAHGNVKSSARLLCSPERQHEFQGWDTPYVHDTVDVLAPEAGPTAPGSAFGSREHVNARAWESVRACDEMRSAIGSVDHAPTEMILTRQCADVSKLMYMRINRDLLDSDWSLLTDRCGPLSAPRSMGTCRTTPGGKPSRASPAAGWASVQRWASRSPHSSPAVSCAALWCPPWSTTSATPLASRTSSS